jgi:hypothetical protein
MDPNEQRTALRAAVYRRDGPTVVYLLHGVGAYDDLLQLAGDGLIAAVMQRVDGPPSWLAISWLRSGSEAGTGTMSRLTSLMLCLAAAPAPILRALPVDLQELASTLEGDPLSARPHRHQYR